MSTSTDPPSPNSLATTEPRLRATQITLVEQQQPVAERSLTPIQALISNVLLRHVLQHEPDESGWYTIIMSQLQHLLQGDSRDCTPLLTAASALQRIRYEWDAPANAQNRKALFEGKIGTSNHTLIRVSILFPEVEVTLETLRFQVSKPFASKLLQSAEMNADLDLGVIQRLHTAAGSLISEQTPRGSKLGRARQAPREV